jgi:acetoin:2,6-dichlorophenolindophenol oxidoreductase subunit beta
MSALANKPVLTRQSRERISYMDAIVQAQIEEMQRDERVILMGEDLAIYGDGKVLNTFGSKRVWCTPISENSFSGMAVGAAMTGLRPIVALSIASFMYLASDQIINQAGKLHYMTGGQMKVPAVFRCSMYYSSSIAAQHSDRPYPMFMNAPGLKILAPTSPSDMKGLLKAAIRDEDPVVVFEDSTLWTSKEEVSTDPDFLVPIGSADIKHEGSDVTVVAIAGAMKAALAAAKELKTEGILVEVVDPRTLVPLDKDTVIRSVAKTGRLIVVDNANRTCNAAAEIAAMVAEEAFESLRKPILRLSTPDVHIPFSPALEKPLYPSKDSIIAAVRRLV